MPISILLSYLFGQPGLFGQYDNDVIGEPMHVLIPSNFTLQYFKSQQIQECEKIVNVLFKYVHDASSTSLFVNNYT